MGAYGSGYYGSWVYGALTALTLTVQETYPDRVLVTATELAQGMRVTVTRRAAGETVRVPVRNFEDITSGVDVLTRADAEPPFGVNLTYTLTVDDVDLENEVLAVALSGGKVAISDAIAGNAAEVVILAWPEKSRVRPTSVFPVGGRNIVVSGSRGGFSGTIEVFTETDDQKNNLLDLLDTATSGIVQVRQSGPYDGVDAFVSVQSDTERRYSQDGSDERRVIVLDVVEATRWAPGLESSTFTLADIATAYTGLTLQELANDYATLLGIAQGDYS